VAGKVTVCLASHWSCVTDSVIYLGVQWPKKGDEHPAYPYAPVEYSVGIITSFKEQMFSRLLLVGLIVCRLTRLLKKLWMTVLKFWEGRLWDKEQSIRFLR